VVADDGGAALARGVKCVVDACPRKEVYRGLSRGSEFRKTSVWIGGCNERYAGDEHDVTELGKRRLKAGG